MCTPVVESPVFNLIVAHARQEDKGDVLKVFPGQAWTFA